MVSTFKKLGVVAALGLAFASTAQANTATLAGSGSAIYFNAPSSSFFEDVFTFVLSGPSTISYNVAEVSSPYMDIALLRYGLFDSNLDAVSGVLSSGTYTLQVSGKSIGLAGGLYSLDYSVAAAVPEPETNAMMLLGLGLMGVVAYRRKSAV